MCCNWTVCGNAIRWGKALGSELLKTKAFGYLLVLAVALTLLFGLALFVIDANVKTPFDGIWSAWVTMTHVGFGDVVPISLLGRLLAALLILFGLVLFSLFTALVSVTLIGKNMDALGLGMKRLEQETVGIESGETRILAELARLHQRMDHLERRLASSAAAEPGWQEGNL